MLIPIGDINPRTKFPVINYSLIGLNILIFFLTYYRPDFDQITLRFGLVPAELNPITLGTSMFLHGSLGHLVGNMLFLWIGGDNVEDRLGHFLYLLFYLASGFVSGIVHAASVTGISTQIPCIGASGAVAGVMGAYLVLFPFSQIKFLIWIFLFISYITLPSFIAIGFWFVWQLIAATSVPEELTQVAYWAHVGGFAFGCAFTTLWALVARHPLLARPKRRYRRYYYDDEDWF
jgi:membrane associated rhomboid family serine protease